MLPKACDWPGASVVRSLEYTSSNMRTYYFDLQDGVPTRDRQGIELATISEAIEHGKALAKRLRDEPRRRDAALSVIVLDESGTEIHRERVYPGPAERSACCGDMR